MDATNSATKTTTPQNDLSRTISMMPSIHNWLRCTPEVRQKIYPTDVIVNSEPLI
jgi:hypothetical protein